MDEKQLKRLKQFGVETSNINRTELDSRELRHDVTGNVVGLSKRVGCSEKAKPSSTNANATDAVFSSAAANNYYQAIGYRMGSATAKSNSNEGKNIGVSWKGLKEDASLDTNATKSEENSYKHSLGDGSITTMQKNLAYAMEKGRTPAEVADYLSHVDESTKEMNNRHTEELLAEALDNNKMYAEVVKFLLKAQEVKRKEEDGKIEMKTGGKTPAEIVQNFQQIEEEIKTRELVQQAQKVCKTPNEPTDYFLMKARKEQINDEQGCAQELVNKQGMIRSGVAAYLLMKAAQEKGYARPRSSATLNSSMPLPVKSLYCHSELSMTSSVTDHLKSVPSIASVASSECSIVTEKNSNVACRPSAVSQKKNMEKKSSSSLLIGLKPFSNRTKKNLHREGGGQDTTKATGKPEASELVTVDKNGEGGALLGAKLISEDLDGENQEITLVERLLAGNGESGSASDQSSSLCDNIKVEDKEKEKDKGCIGKVKRGVDERSDSKPDVGQKVNEVSKDLKTSLKLKGNLKRILTFKKKSSTENEEKSPRKKIDSHKPKTCGGSSDGTEETDTKSCFSNESGTAVKTEYDMNKTHESSSELLMDSPIASISIPGSNLTIDDEVTLPSVLRKKAKMNIWNEPAALKKWWSDVSTQYDSETEISRYSRDYTRYSEDNTRAEQGCLCSVRECKHEIDSFAYDIREFCSATAQSTKAGLYSICQRASAMLGCDSTDLQEQTLPGSSSTKNNILAQMETKSDDNEVVEIEIVRTETNELKTKRSIRELGSF